MTEEWYPTSTDSVVRVGAVLLDTDPSLRQNETVRSLSGGDRRVRAFWRPRGRRNRQGGATLPYVSVRITRDGVTREQKARIVAEITDTLRRVLGKRPEHTHVVIDEVEPDDWGFAGMLTPDYRARQGERG